MSYSSTALHVTTLQGFHISDIKADLPLFSSKVSENKVWSRFNSVLQSQKVLDLLVLCIVILCFECFHCYVIIIDCLLTSFDILYFSTDGCINKSITYLPYLLTYSTALLHACDEFILQTGHSVAQPRLKSTQNSAKATLQPYSS